MHIQIYSSYDLTSQYQNHILIQYKKKFINIIQRKLSLLKDDIIDFDFIADKVDLYN